MKEYLLKMKEILHVEDKELHEEQPTPYEPILLHYGSLLLLEEQVRANHELLLYLFRQHESLIFDPLFEKINPVLAQDALEYMAENPSIIKFLREIEQEQLQYITEYSKVEHEGTRMQKSVAQAHARVDLIRELIDQIKSVGKKEAEVDESFKRP